MARMGSTLSRIGGASMMGKFTGGGVVSGGGRIAGGGVGGGGTTTSPSLSNVYSGLAADYKAAQAEQQERYRMGLGEMAEAAGLFGPGYGAGMERTALAGARQGLIGRGLGGTTRPMAVGAGMKAQFEDLRRGKLATALARKAEYRRTSPQIYPAAGVLANLALGARSSALQEQAMQPQPLTFGGAGVGGGGTTYPALPTFYSGNVGSAGGVSGVGGVDFSLPGIQTTQQEPAFDYTGYRSDIQAAGKGSQRIIGAPEWMQPYNQLA